MPCDTAVLRQSKVQSTESLKQTRAVHPQWTAPTENVVFFSGPWLRTLRPSPPCVVRDSGRRRSRTRRNPDGMSPKPELFATLLGKVVLVVVTGIVFALGRDMPAGTM